MYRYRFRLMILQEVFVYSYYNIRDNRKDKINENLISRIINENKWGERNNRAREKKINLCYLKNFIIAILFTCTCLNIAHLFPMREKVVFKN